MLNTNNSPLLSIDDDVCTISYNK